MDETLTNDLNTKINMQIIVYVKKNDNQSTDKASRKSNAKEQVDEFTYLNCGPSAMMDIIRNK